MHQFIFKLNPKLLGLLIACLGLVVLFGWYTHNTVLIQVRASFAPMQYNTALGFLLSGLGLFFAAWSKPKTSAALGFLLILIGGLTLVQYIANIDLPIDQLFMDHYITTQTASPGRMAPNTALCFLLTGITLFALNTFSNLEAFKLLGAVITGLGAIAIIGYLTDIETAYGWGHLTRMAVHTSTGFIVLGVGITLWDIPATNDTKLLRQYWGPSTASITLTVVVLLLWQALNGWNDSIISSKVYDQLASVKHTFERHLQSQQNSLQLMAKRWEVQQGTPQHQWNNDAHNYIAGLKDIKAILWFDRKFKAQWVTSEKTYTTSDLNKFSQLKEIQTSLEQARDGLQASMSKILTINQGDPFFTISIPLLKNNKFDGVILAAFHIDSMLAQFYTDDRFWKNFYFQLYEDEVLVFGESITNVNAMRYQASTSTTINNQSLKLTLYPTDSKIKELSSILPETVLIIGLLSSFMVILLYMLRRREKEKSLQLTEEIKRHKKTKNKLIYEESRLRSILDTMADAVILIDIDETILSLNQAAKYIFGYQADEVLNKSIRQLIPASDNQRTEAYRNYFLAGGKPKNIDEDISLTAVRKNGDKFSISLAISAMKIDGQYLFSAIVRDISKEKQQQAIIHQHTKQLERTNRELTRSNQELSDFAYVASHDLKAPLRGIMQLSNWIAEDLRGKVDEPITEYIELIKSRTARLERLLDDLLAYSRSGRKHGDFIEVDVAQMAQELFQLLSPPPTFQLECSENLPRFVTLTAPLELILRNLINNAIKHHHRKSGTIKINATSTDKGYLFTVSDDGPGIDPQFHQRAFGLFQTLKPRDEVEGSGMGLAIIKKLLDTYHCEITIDSDGIAGSCIQFTWPNEATLRRLINE